MINYFNAIIFGFVQGVTEFLPVSSSGHLVLLHKIIELPIKNEIAFDVSLHFATFLAILFFFYKDLWRIFIAWLKSFKDGSNNDSRLAWYIVLATIPAGILGLLFNDVIENTLRSPLVVVVMLIVVGLLFIFVERVGKKTLELNSLNWQKSLGIGLSQAIALIPGTSRSGITIIAGLFTGLKREDALRFSFLISLPIILGASLKEIPLLFSGNFSFDEFMIIAIAFFSTLIFGIITISFFLRFVKNNSLNIFAWYRFFLAVLILIFMYV